ncbi:alpha/beta hydrolase [Rhodoblastus sp.]|uniref:alpha/beta hydrolase n=1 Tax=Rhodoblastus sp. TaxID=1962975 RepID=UPI003F9D8D2C
MSPSLVILLHGVNADGADLAPLADMLRPALPGANFAAPDAPFPTPFGFQWFSLDGITAQNRLQRVVEARAAFDALLSRIVEAHGLAANPRRVALVGFSQGAIMALDALATGRWPVAGVVAFSGRFSSPPPYAPSLQTPALLVHGDADDVIPWSESRDAEEALKKLGVSTRLRVLAGVDHCVTPEGADLAANFLAPLLGEETGTS